MKKLHELHNNEGYLRAYRKDLDNGTLSRVVDILKEIHPANEPNVPRTTEEAAARGFLAAGYSHALHVMQNLDKLGLQPQEAGPEHRAETEEDMASGPYVVPTPEN